MELDRLANVGRTDVVLYPSSADLAQVELLGDAVTTIEMSSTIMK
jgi:hypothetical protein